MIRSQNKFAAIILLTVFLFFSAPRQARAQFPPAPGTGPGLAETIEAIDAARVTTRILYITAHPDDESAAVLTYLARGLHADVALLSLTHGEGGQNALGPEQAPQLGLIRTQELLAATRGYGVKLYFTRAKDFGFSKTPEETEKIWGDQVLEDMVRIIRTFRPNIVINNWGGVHTGHGHHQAAGILTPKAVAAAKDNSFCKDCGEIWSVEQILDLERGAEHPTGYVLPLDEISPLWGKTWREIGIDAFANHRTQGITAFLSSPFIRRPVALKSVDGSKFSPDSLAQPLTSLALVPGAVNCPGMDEKTLAAAQAKIAASREQALTLNWTQATANLVSAAKNLNAPISMNSQPAGCTNEALEAVINAESRIGHALELAAGLRINATTDEAYITAGGPFKVSIETHCRKEIPCVFESVGLLLPEGMKQETTDFKASQITVNTLTSSIKANEFQVGKAEGTGIVSVNETLSISGYVFSVQVPVKHIAATSTRVDLIEPRVVPRYTVFIQPQRKIEIAEKNSSPFDVFLHVHSYSVSPEKISAGIQVPNGWKVSDSVALDFSGAGDQYAKLTVTPPGKIAPGNYNLSAFAQKGNETFSTLLEPLPTMPTILWSEPAECKVHAFDINVPQNLRVGYISAESEPVPQALRDVGVNVDLLDANTVNFGDLSKYDAIVVGVRAYELRPELPGANQRLLDYAQNGGTLLVQYQRDFTWNNANFAPYPAKIDNSPASSLARITDETSPVKFLKPDDPLLNKPNKITQSDFGGWIQERGLYFWTNFDEKYTPLLVMNDPGEKDLNGGLVYTKFGKGTYIYTGLAFFRQLPEGVPGAYRLFVNLLSANRH